MESGLGGDFTEDEGDIFGDSGVVVVGRGDSGAKVDDGEVTVMAALAAEGEVDVSRGGWWWTGE